MYTSGQLALFLFVQPVLGEHLNTHTEAALGAFARELLKCGLPNNCELSYERNRYINNKPYCGVLVILSPEESTIGGLNTALTAANNSGQLNIFAEHPYFAGRWSESANAFVWRKV